VKLRLLVGTGGQFSGGAGLNYRAGGRRGDIFEFSDVEGRRWLELGYATTDLTCDYRLLPQACATRVWQH
jgi:hypothetical protein